MTNPTPLKNTHPTSPLRQARKVWLYRTLINDGEINIMAWADQKKIPGGWTLQELKRAADDVLLDGYATIDPWMTLHPRLPEPEGTEG